MYTEEDLLMLSGIQHYAFCPRQWALIHIEQQWQSNHLTLEGDYLHERVDNPECQMAARNAITLRAVPLVSYQLGLCGISDAVELRPSQDPENTIEHPDYPGHYRLYPVEYKHGKPKPTQIDTLQLCAQAMALEEMYRVRIDSGALYYGETRHRQEIAMDEQLRSLTRQTAHQMHATFESQRTPIAPKSAKCRNCSMLELCMPQIADIRQPVDAYLKDLFHA